MTFNPKKIALVFVFLATGAWSTVFAQTLPGFDTSVFDRINQGVERQFQQALEQIQELQKPSVEIETETKTPLPGAPVLVLASFPKGGDPGQVMFRWSLDGETALEGFGQYRFGFKAKEQTGLQTTVTLTALFQNSPPIVKEITFVTADVLLTFNARSIVPAGYRGLNLPTTNAPVSVSAVAILGVQNDPDSLKYQWQLNGRTINSGYGLRTVSFLTEGQGGANEVTVEITSPEVALNISKTVRIPIVNPEVILYPEQGSFKAVAGKEISANERGLLFAQPYFFSARTDNLEFRWEFLNQRTSGLGQEFSNLRYGGPGKDQLERLGTTPLRLNVRNPGNSLQQASVVVPMRFK